MGRIKTKLVKRTGKKLFHAYPDKFKSNFEENKRILPELVELNSKKLRNVIAGYLTRLVKNNKE